MTAAGSLARAAQDPGRNRPDRQRSVAAGWELFKRQLQLHHTAEDELIWPAPARAAVPPPGQAAGGVRATGSSGVP